MDDVAFLRLLTWLSPAFPTGGFAYSHGLEWAVEAGDITDDATTLSWLTDLLAEGSGRNDVIVLRHAHRGEPVACFAAALAFGRERLLETAAQGKAFLQAASVWTRPDAQDHPCPYPFAVGIVARANRIPEEQAALAYLHAFAANLISAAIRLVPLGQQAGLRVQAALEPVLIEVARHTRAATLDDIGTATLRADLASLRHETQHTRLFRT